MKYFEKKVSEMANYELDDKIAELSSIAEDTLMQLDTQLRDARSKLKDLYKAIDTAQYHYDIFYLDSDESGEIERRIRRYKVKIQAIKQCESMIHYIGESLD